MANEVWTFAEQTEGHLDSISYELLGRGRALADKLGTKLCSVVLGWKIDRDDIQELFKRGTDKVYMVEKRKLLKVLRQGNRTLYKIANDMVENYFSSI